MALDTRQCCMRSGQRIVGVERMIEIDICPVRGCVAGVTRSWETCGYVIRISGSGPIGLMASVTGGRQRRVVVVGVALCAGHRSVSACKWKHRGMIERRRRPRTRGVAESAVRGEARGYVRRIICAGKICLVTAVTGGWKRCVIVVGVALCTGHRSVRTRQRKGCVVVIERCVGPRRGVVTHCAVGRETR